jgi:hypothetical protein
MTLPPEKIGDKGQRFKIRSFGYPKQGWNDIGYSATRADADRISSALMTNPSCTMTMVIDREPPSDG